MARFRLDIPFDLGRGLARIPIIGSLFTRLSDAFDTATGHTHAGSGEGARIPFAGARVFISVETTGTGAIQNIAHGLGAIPAGVLVVPTDTAPATIGVYTAVEGVHTTINVVVTVTSGKRFKVFAWA